MVFVGLGMDAQCFQVKRVHSCMNLVFFFLFRFGLVVSFGLLTFYFFVISIACELSVN